MLKLTREDLAIIDRNLQRNPTLDFFSVCGDREDYRAMLTREEHRADGRAPGESTRRPGQWVNMVEALRMEGR